jgi:hypothetical protein
MAKTVNVDIDEKGTISVDIIGGIDGSCKAIADGCQEARVLSEPESEHSSYRKVSEESSIRLSLWDVALASDALQIGVWLWLNKRLA